MSWDWSLMLVLDALLLVASSAVLIGLFLRDLWRR